MAISENLKAPTEVCVISTLPPIEKGMSKYTMGFVKALVLSGHFKVEFLGFNKIYPSFLYPGKINSTSTKNWDFKSPLLKVKNHLNWYNPIGWAYQALKIRSKIIHIQHWTFVLAPVYWAILCVCKWRGKKILMTVHNVNLHEKGFIQDLLYKSVFRFANEFIVHTEKNKNQLSLLVNKKIHVIPHGLIEPPISELNKTEARKILKINQDDKVLLCFGNIRAYKGIDDAIKALSLIKNNSVKLIIAGESWENFSKYHSLIDNFNLQDRVITQVSFIPDEDIEIYFKATDIVLLPYKDFDAQSGVGSLVLPFEKPMIVSKTGGLPDLVLDEIARVTPENPDELAKRILLVLSNKELEEKLIQDSKKLKMDLSWNNIVPNYIEVYNTLIRV